MKNTHEINCDFPRGSEPALIRPLALFLKQMLRDVCLPDSVGHNRMAIAVEEVLLNAVYNGEIKIDRWDLAVIRSGLRDEQLSNGVRRRGNNPPSSNRSIAVQVDVCAFEAKFVIRAHGLDITPCRTFGRIGTHRIERKPFRKFTLITNLARNVAYIGATDEVTLLIRHDKRGLASPMIDGHAVPITNSTRFQ